MATRDQFLRNIRKIILSKSGYSVEAPLTDEDTAALIESDKFGLLILGTSLEPNSRIRIAAIYRHRQGGRIIEMVKNPLEEPLTDADAVVLGIDGPLALRTAVEKQIGKAV